MYLKNSLETVVIVFLVGISFVQAADYPFRDVTLSWEDRVEDLVDRISLFEMVEHMAYGGGGVKTLASVPRLGIGPYNFDTECLRGVMSQLDTAYPQAVGLAATFSPHSVSLMAEAVATEARAIFHNASSRGEHGDMQGISCLAPFINIMRHPLWGRVQEVYGEDPYLAGRMAAGYVHGLHGSHPRYVRASSGCKVIGLYSGPENNPSRFSFDAQASLRDLRLTYFPAFKACVEAGTFNLMCSYYKTNGIPSCADQWIMQDVMRGEYGFKGYVITDMQALERMVTEHHYFNNLTMASAAAANAGVNLELTGSEAGYLKLYDAVKQGLVSPDTIRELVKPLFYTRMRLGEFDPPEMNPYSAINMSVIQSTAHQQLAVTIATQSFVMLKNDGTLLPLKKKLSSIAVLGPFADDLTSLYGNYNPVPDSTHATTVYQGLKLLANNATLTPGCNNALCAKYDSMAVKHAVVDHKPQVIFVALGTGTVIETEGLDRVSLELPKNQTQLLTDVVRYAQDTPVVLLLFTAGPVNISWARHSPSIPVILQCFFPAQATGEALRRVLSITEHGVISPSGRLPYTWPASLDQVPPMVNYSMEGRTYRYFRGPGAPLYPFGYGLSYSSFKYSNLVIHPSTVRPQQDVSISVWLSNTGKYPADEVSQVYITWVNSTSAMPQRQLVAFSRTSTSPGHIETLTFTVTADQLMVWDDTTEKFVDFEGQVEVYVGGQQPDQETDVGSNVLKGSFQISALY